MKMMDRSLEASDILRHADNSSYANSKLSFWNLTNTESEHSFVEEEPNKFPMTGSESSSHQRASVFSSDPDSGLIQEVIDPHKYSISFKSSSPASGGDKQKFLQHAKQLSK